MINRFFLICLIISSTCHGQNDKVDYDFMNTVKNQIVDSNYSSYFLVNEILEVNTVNDEYMAEFNEFLPQQSLNEIIQKINSDTRHLLWSCDSLIGAKCISNDTVSSITRSYIDLKLKSKWSKNKRKREIKKQTKAFFLEKDETPLNERSVYSFSRPYFDENKNWAMISIHFTCGKLCGYSCLYLFKNAHNKWSLVTEKKCSTY